MKLHVGDLSALVGIIGAFIAGLLTYHALYHQSDREIQRKTNARVTASTIKEMELLKCDGKLNGGMLDLLAEFYADYKTSAGREYTWPGCPETTED